MCFGSSWKAPALNIIRWLECKTQEQFRPFGVFAFSPPALSDSHSENKLSVTRLYVTHFIIKVRLSFCSVLKRIVNNYIQCKYINIKIYKYQGRDIYIKVCWVLAFFVFKNSPPRGSEWLQKELPGLNTFSTYMSKKFCLTWDSLKRQLKHRPCQCRPPQGYGLRTENSKGWWVLSPEDPSRSLWVFLEIKSEWQEMPRSRKQIYDTLPISAYWEPLLFFTAGGEPRTFEAAIKPWSLIVLSGHLFYRCALHLGGTVPGDRQPFNVVLR